MKLRLVLGAGVGVAAMLLAPLPALADEPLPQPTNLHALHVSDTAADLDWLSGGVAYGDVVQRNVNGSWQTYATGAFGFLALTNLTPGTTYTFRVYSPAVPGLEQGASPPSAPLSFTTLSGPDAVPPEKPRVPTFSSVTTTVATVFWPQTTDNVRVTGYYLQQLIGGVWTTIRTVGEGGNFQTVYGLTASTSYSFAAIAFDARGNTSPRSDPGTVTTLALTPTPTCRVQLISFAPGFTVTVTITNTTAATLNGWTVRFTVPAAAVINYSFNGVLTRDGSTGTVTPQFYNTTIGPGGQTYPGFSGTVSPFTPPSAFTLNGVPCVAG
jgi:hypothetical protein